MSHVNLEQIVKKGRANVLSGRSDGASARAQLHLNEIEDRGGPINFSVPDALAEMTPSFVLGLFSATFRKIADGPADYETIRQRFFDLYLVEKPKIRRDIEDAIADYVDVERSLAALTSLKH